MIKETNMEHFRSEIKEIIARHKHFLPAVVDGKPVECEGLGCNKCMLYEATEPCSIHFVKWLMSEYKPEPVLTEREKHFVEFAQEGWLARDEEGDLWWYREKPEKGTESWKNGKVLYSFKGMLDFKQYFRFITWEDEEPWSIKRLRELKVADE